MLTQQQQEDLLRNYLDHIVALYLQLRASETVTPVRVLARALTLVTLPRLDADRRGVVLQFLSDAELLAGTPIVNLTGADLQGVNLPGASLQGVNLPDANLQKANLSGADLTGANLSRVDLQKANLQVANLDGANLSGADLTGANLGGASVAGTNFTNVIGSSL